MPAPLVIPGGHSSEVLQSIDAALHEVSLLIGFRIMAGRPSTSLSPLQPRFLRVFALWTDTADPTGPEGPSVHSSPICPIHPKTGRTLSRTTLHHPWHPHRVQERDEKRRIRRLPGRHEDGQWPSSTLAQDVDLAGPTAPADPEPFIDTGPLFSPAGSVLRAPLALRWARMWVLSTAALSQSISPC